MSKLDLHEQEQISNLKYIWQRAGKYIVSVLVLCLLAYGVNSWWVWYSSSKASKAATVYASFTDAYNSKDKTKEFELAGNLQDNYSSTQYASMATLLAAKTAWENNDLPESTKLLNWIIDNSKDKGMVSTAKLRLADVYIDEKKFDKAMKLLTDKTDPAFDPLFYSKRGDLYVAEGELNKARDAYKEALKKSGQDSNVSQGIQMKLDILGNN